MKRTIILLILCFGFGVAWSEVNRQTQANISEVGVQIEGLNRTKQDSLDFATRAPNSSDGGTVWVQYTAANDDTMTQHLRHPASGVWVSSANGDIRGWVKFNGTGTLAIDDSYNVTSVTDNGIGDYTVNWDTDFSNALYAAVCSAGEDNSTPSDARVCSVSTMAAGTTRVSVRLIDNSLRDVTRVNIVAIGDQ